MTLGVALVETSTASREHFHGGFGEVYVAPEAVYWGTQLWRETDVISARL